jgi:anti-anti-sigma factor
LLAKRPHFEQRGGGLEYAVSFAKSKNRRFIVKYSMGTGGRPVGFWPGGGFLIEDLFAITAADGPVYADTHLIVTRTDNPDGFRFAGEIDVTNSDAVMQSVRMAIPDAGDPHLDLSRLSFCDISGIRAIVDAATALGEGRRMLLHGLPEQLQTVMKVTGWSGLPSLTLCNCPGEAE